MTKNIAELKQAGWRVEPDYKNLGHFRLLKPNGSIWTDMIYPKEAAWNCAPDNWRKRDKALILTVGLPRSGKSTWARRTGLPIVSPDAIRLALYGQPYIAEAEPMVWTIAKIMVKSIFLSGALSVVLDATNTTRERRDEWLSDDWDTYYKEIPTDAGTCITRAYENSMSELVPVIEKMSEEYQSLTEEELKTKWGRE